VSKKTPLDPYQRRLLAFLSVATFFEGYDFFALTQILPNLRADLGLSPQQGGYLVALINAGTVIAYLLVRKADRWGRRRVLTVTIAGYTVFTGLSGLAPNAVVFGLLQLCARIFLIAEWAVSHVIAAEEFPANRRGFVIGLVSAFASLGSVVCAGVVPLLLKTPFGWRSVYFVGIVPLLLLAYARRELKETRRFAEQRPSEESGLTEILHTPYRGRVLKLGAIWFLTYICTQNGVTFWKEFALAERGMTDAGVGAAISIAAVAAMPPVFLAGKLLDWLGRRRGAAVIFTLTSVGVFGAYSVHGYAALVVSLTLGVFGATAVLPVLNAFSTELFPTRLRGSALAWSNNLIGRVGYVLSPLGIGVLVTQWGWGATIRWTGAFPILALALILLFLPETGKKELEETSAV
jgi:putative MFS transporter